MNTAPDKVMGLEAAVRQFVPDGAHLSIGGFTCNRNPMAAVYEIIRQKKRNLHLYAHSNGQGGRAGRSRLRRLHRNCLRGNRPLAPTCIRFQGGRIESILFEDYSTTR
jgi:glutaconate CoA-transferase subunit A